MDNEELRLVAAEIRKCGELLIGVAERLSRTEKEVESTASNTKSEASLTIEDVRKVLAEKSRDGFTSNVRDLLAKHGADRLSDVKPAEYADILKEAESFGK